MCGGVSVKMATSVKKQTSKSKRPPLQYKKIPEKDLQYITDLGRGQFGDVHKAKWNDKMVAVKKFALSNPDAKGGFSQELKSLHRLQPHPNIITLHGAWEGGAKPYIVMEFAPSSLEKVLHRQKKEYRYTADHVINWSYQAALALEYIHSLDMLHRDVKPSNMLLFNNGTKLKVCDFGTAKKVAATLTHLVGTIRYMAPEVIKSGHYTNTCDVFSFGMVVWEMVTRKVPALKFGGGKGHQNNMSILYGMANGDRPPPVRNVPKIITELIDKSWDNDPQKRPPMKELRQKLHALCQYVEVSKPLIPLRKKLKQTQATKKSIDSPKDEAPTVVPGVQSTASTDSSEYGEVEEEDLDESEVIKCLSQQYLDIEQEMKEKTGT